MKSRIIVILILIGSCFTLQAQKFVATKPDTIIKTAAVDTSVLGVMAKGEAQPIVKPPQKSNPNKILLYALVPGLGQVYNHKYWKLPILYGGLMGCMYAITWNNKNYQDYKSAYFDIIYDYAQYKGDKNYKNWGSWINYVPEGSEATYVANTQFQENLKRRKDYYRRYRDLSIIISIGVYAISIIDAYVDSQLFDFDISPDLSFHWSPEVTPKTHYTTASYGLNCSFYF
ncbi:MAG: DUF5683 domain-containing protein [Parabacteroides sp.]|nr:DUF5683 domain-containing protein [Parabacteroides sp.]